ncbi:RodZ domain-containing protein [Microbulbifer thermotolerans]|uniref:Cytoskeleton protein RodZ-like C-terminal domain-containing protein n=1 Tax=Microbulbifer thermotolerans TaxID=252514 RepID=A0A143HNT0_MICTH|nr:RodZ domain-containing protein [Microbulbifer thermotolerans]AMX03090.1 hypothetical protein A3224_11385 [Microbulbifer thermotolerans]MCX2835878.1 DUF4115 domain-containing protein [Microbulbifer thermotolerans]
MTDNLSDIAREQTGESREQLLDNSPGSQLQRAREAAGLSREELSNRLCMTGNKLELLERDQYDRLPGAIYVRGYIRNLCKELNIDEGPVLQAFSGYCSAEEESREILAHVSRGGEVSPVRHRMRGLLVLPLLLVGVVFWWLYGRDVAQQPAALANGGLYPEAPRDELAAVEPEGGDVVVADGAAAADSAESEAELSAMPAIEADPISAVGESEQVPAIAEPQAVVTPATSAEESGSGQSVEPSAASVDGALRLTFVEESWVEVKDASGRVLLAKLQPAGTEVELSGEAPYQLMLGNARGTQVRYRGELIDSDPIGSRRTRRLTVGE